jgi:peptidoglycan/LPS O-acetylase OafA/YrhL
VGAISYALYLFHFPLICDLRLLSGETSPIFYIDLFLRIVIAFALAWLTERHLQKWINSATNPWLVLLAKNQTAGGELAGK